MSLTDKARVKDFSWLEQTLLQLEDPDQCDRVPRHTTSYLFIKPDERLSAGEVLFNTGSGGGRPDTNPHDVVSAASAVLAQSQYADVSRKLHAYGGIERHVVLVVDEEKDFTFSWLRRASPQDVDQFPVPELPPEITHLWITPRSVPGLTMAWSGQTGWEGTAWGWGDPIEALNAWNDPACPDDHSAPSR